MLLPDPADWLIWTRPREPRKAESEIDTAFMFALLAGPASPTPEAVAASRLSEAASTSKPTATAMPLAWVFPTPLVWFTETAPELFAKARPPITAMDRSGAVARIHPVA